MSLFYLCLVCLFSLCLAWRNDVVCFHCTLLVQCWYQEKQFEIDIDEEVDEPGVSPVGVPGVRSPLRFF